MKKLVLFTVALLVSTAALAEQALLIDQRPGGRGKNEPLFYCTYQTLDGRKFTIPMDSVCPSSINL